MSWLSKLAHNLGLMIHNIRHPEDKNTKVIRKETTEEKMGNITLRRTTIDEIEIRDDDKQLHD